MCLNRGGGGWRQFPCPLTSVAIPLFSGVECNKLVFISISGGIQILCSVHRYQW